MTAVQKTLAILLACIALVLGLTLYKVLNRQSAADPTRLLDAGIVLLQEGRPLPALELTNQDGQPQLLNQLRGQWSLVFFGYTFCPDICPTTLADLRMIKNQLPPAAREQLRIVMVSVDPQRDTPQQLKLYLGYFDASFLGLTGSPQNIQQAANALGVPFIPADNSQTNYTVDHGANLSLIDPQGVQRGFIRAPLRKDQLSAELPGLIGG
jgi:protein SCO1/2